MNQIICCGPAESDGLSTETNVGGKRHVIPLNDLGISALAQAINVLLPAAGDNRRSIAAIKREVSKCVEQLQLGDRIPAALTTRVATW